MSTLNTFELIYAENYQAMFRVAYKMLGDNDGAADIVQDVCISFFHRLSNGLDVNNAKAWLNKVTYIKCMDHFRKMKRLRENELIENIAIEEEQKAIQQKAIDKYSSIKNPIFFMVKTASADEEKQIIDENKKAWERILIEMKADLEKISDPFPYPSFSVLIQDSDENLLFFEFPEENDANKFNVWVYKNGGGFVCQSSFVCDEYTLEINPSKMVFHNGCLYGLLHKINVNGVSGKVLIQFVVNAIGIIERPTIIRSVDPALDQEAVRVIMSSPQWTPGKQRGKAVNVIYTFPINFVLQ